MKKILPFLLGVSSASMSSWSRISKTWDSLVRSENVPDDDRAIIELFTISAVANYGCWCRFADYKPYRGPAQDSVDLICKEFYQNYDCMAFDFNSTCNAFEVNYNDAITQITDPFNTATDLVSACNTENPTDNCAATACAVDSHFIRGIFNFMRDSTLNMTLSGFYGFDGSACVLRAVVNSLDSSTTMPPAPFATQPTQANPTVAGVVNLDCCGDYPSRYPYKPNGGQKDCCGQTTYNTGLLECCPSQTTALIGAC